MPIDIALLGCAGPYLADVLGVIASEPDVRLAAVYDADRSLIPPPIRDYAVTDPETAIARANAVLVTATLAERPVLCARAARAGRPTLVQVPIAPTAEEARRLHRELERSRTPVLAAFHLRELPALRRLRDTLRAGMLGRVSGVAATLSTAPAVSEPGPAVPAHGVRAPRRDFVSLAVHVIDALAALGEPPRLQAVSLDATAGGGDLGGAAVGRWGHAPLVVRANGASREPGLELVLEGARRTAAVREGTLELRDGPAEPDRWIGGPPDAAEAIRAFAERLRRRGFPRDPLAAAVRAQAIAERAAHLD